MLMFFNCVFLWIGVCLCVCQRERERESASVPPECNNAVPPRPAPPPRRADVCVFMTLYRSAEVSVAE